MNKNLRREADLLYLLLATLFTASLITCNLIANKFISIELGLHFISPDWWSKTFYISAGVLPYPITFLITDVLSEIYGRKKTNQVVVMGFVASIFTLGILWAGAQFPAITASPVSDRVFDEAFGNSWRVIGASMVAYLSAQLVDVRLFHFWKGVTKGKHLWLRNNASTIGSQFIDTTLVVLVLFLGVKGASELKNLIIDGWVFKVICALLDTPIAYLLIYFIRKRYHLKIGGEIK